MKTIKILFFACCMLFSFSTVAQQQVSSEEAKTAAVQFASTRKANKIPIVKNVNSLKRENHTLMYEVVFDDGQGVLLSGSKACLPVLGYYDVTVKGSSIFDDDVSCCLKSMLSEYETQIAQCFKNDTITLYHQSDWHNLRETGTLKNADKSTNNLKASPGAVDIVSPLLTSRWGQGIPNYGNFDDCAYNFYAPYSDCGCGKCLAGCVAVAMAQVMYYWKYPVYNSSMHIMEFDWCNMVDALNTESLNYTNERNAVARLIRNCGVAADMKYCNHNCRSSSTTGKARDALVGNFGYHSNADVQRRIWHSDKEWKSRIKDQLNQGRPVIYSGQSGLFETGHTFVCDGYDSNDYFHFNWGWRGRDDGWFTINGLTPDGHDYNSLQEAIFYLRPSNNDNYCNFNVSLLDNFMGQRNYYSFIYAYNPQLLQTYLDSIPYKAPKYATTLTSAYPATVQGYTVPAAWYTVQSGKSVEYVAHESIKLMPGFKAEAGSHFIARVEPCKNCNSAKVAMKNFKNGVEVEEELYIAVGDNEEEQSQGEGKTVVEAPQVYPNPTTGLLTIDTKNDKSRIQTIELYDAQGAKQFAFDGNHGSFQEIDISHLPSQVYVLKVHVNRQVFTKKIILQK